MVWVDEMSVGQMVFDQKTKQKNIGKYFCPKNGRHDIQQKDSQENGKNTQQTTIAAEDKSYTCSVPFVNLPAK